jgi:hypothetical protein
MLNLVALHAVFFGQHTLQQQSELRRIPLADSEVLGRPFPCDPCGRNNLEAALGEQIAQEHFKRQPCWTEGLAVSAGGRFAMRRENELEKRR